MRRGIDRPEIESLLRPIVIRLTGLPSDSVFFSEYAVDTAACPRPCVSMQIMPYSTEQRQGTVHFYDSFEYWRFVVTSAADGNYSITINGATFTHAASGQTITEIRDDLAALISSPDYVVTTGGAASIDIESRVAGKRLIGSSSVGVSAELLRANTIKITKRFVSLRLEIECVGKSSSPPDVALTGVDIAERLSYSLLDTDETASMRDCGHSIVRVRTTDARRVTDGKMETIGVIDAVLNTTSINVSTIVGDVREIPFTVDGGI